MLVTRGNLHLEDTGVFPPRFSAEDTAGVFQATVDREMTAATADNVVPMLRDDVFSAFEAPRTISEYLLIVHHHLLFHAAQAAFVTTRS